MKKRVRIIIPIALLGLASILLFRFFREQEDNDHLRFSGNIEVTESQLSFRLSGLLAKRSVNEGDAVTDKQPLANLDDSEQQLLVSQAQAKLAQTEALLAELEAGSRPEELDQAAARVEQARQNLLELQNGSREEDLARAAATRDSAVAATETAAVQLEQAKRDFERYNALYKQNSISKNVYDVFETAYATAANRMKEAQAKVKEAEAQLKLLQTGARSEQIAFAKAALEQAEAQYTLAKAGPRQETIEQARAAVAMATAALDQAKLHLDYTTLTAPMDGVILSVSAEPGEFLNPATPVLMLGDLDHPWLRAYINEKYLGRIKLGQDVAVVNDSYPGKTYPGKVTFISDKAEFTPKTVQTHEERVKLMYRIKVSLDNPDHELKPGMPADGTIDLAGN
jgi:HlyD family secretion protein